MGVVKWIGTHKDQCLDLVGTRMLASVNQCAHGQLRPFRDENINDDI